MELTSWELWILITRWLLYIGMAASIGGACSLWLMQKHGVLKHQLLRYTLLAASIAIIFAGIHFLVRVGSAAEEGVAGMFDPDMIAFMWDSPLGQALALRALGLLLFLLAVLFHALVKSRSLEEEIQLDLLEILIATVGIGMIAYSFTEAGHAVAQHVLFHLVLTVHILLTAWWMGSLYPLWLVCHRLSFNEAFIVLERFGQLAVSAVLILFAGGLYMSYQLTGWTGLLANDYGQLLIIKVVLVVLILILAALHKFVLVPKLMHVQDASKLKKSILVEKLVGSAIFAITTVLTTLVGPVH
jgi:putative copper resistance protein D